MIFNDVQTLQHTTPSTPTSERLVKAKSDGSISSSNPPTDNSALLSKLKSKSLEPLTGEMSVLISMILPGYKTSD